PSRGAFRRVDGMERAGRVQIWAGVAMLALCVVIGAVEVRTLVDVGAATGYVAGWVAVFVAYLAAVLVAAVRAGLAPGRGGAVLVARAVLAAAALVLRSPRRSGLVLILLVLAAALSALHLDLRGVVVVITASSVVVLASSLAVGPLVDRASPLAEALLTAALHAPRQAGSAGTRWSPRRDARGSGAPS